jgi:hypothetical protein
MAILVDTQLNGANLVDCNVYGISVWNLQLEGAIQISLSSKSTILKSLSFFTYS